MSDSPRSEALLSGNTEHKIAPLDVSIKDYHSMNIGQLTAEYCRVLDEMDGLGAFLDRLSAAKEAMKEAFLLRSRAEGVEKFFGPTVTITISKKPVVRIMPTADWPMIQKSLVEQNLGGLMKREICGGKKFQELVDGGWRLLDGLKLEEIDTVSHRRS